MENDLAFIIWIPIFNSRSKIFTLTFTLILQGYTLSRNVHFSNTQLHINDHEYSCFNCFDLVWNTDTNACKTKNGQCSQLCLPTGQNQRVCVCTAGYERKNETYCAGEYSVNLRSKKCYFVVLCSFFLDRNSFVCSLKIFLYFSNVWFYKCIFLHKKKNEKGKKNKFIFILIKRLIYVWNFISIY